jgi:hypothetical protein
MVARESAQETIKLVSSYETRNAVLYATVNEITVGADGEVKEFMSPVMTDRTNTVTSWIDISRGRIVIPSGETAEIPLGIKVHPFAQPGEYHVFIGFVEASKRSTAEAVALRGDADGVVVKITVADEREDSMRITSMTVDRFVTRDNEKEVLITVENAGDIASAPQGELIYYDSRGREVMAVSVNSDGERVAPNSTKTFSALIPMDTQLGRFKANVNLEYGENQRANLYDTTSFILLPLPYLIALAGLLFSLMIILFILLRRSQRMAIVDEEGDSVTMFVRDGHAANPKDHDIDLTK